MSQVQPAFASSFGNCFDDSVILKPSSIEYHPIDSVFFGLAGDQLAQRVTLRNPIPLFARLQLLRLCRQADDGMTGVIINNLGLDVPQGATHDESGALRGSDDLLASSETTTLSRCVFLLLDVGH